MLGVLSSFDDFFLCQPQKRLTGDRRVQVISAGVLTNIHGHMKDQKSLNERVLQLEPAKC